MLRPILLGAVAGARAMTPLAVIANAARLRRLAAQDDIPDLLAHPAVSVVTTVLAIGELVGDKRADAPDRTIPAALIVRTLNAAIAGAMVVPRHERWLGATAAGITAAGATWLSWRARTAAMRSHRHDTTGLVEDAIVVPTAIAAATAR